MRTTRSLIRQVLENQMELAKLLGIIRAEQIKTPSIEQATALFHEGIEAAKVQQGLVGQSALTPEAMAEYERGLMMRGNVAVKEFVRQEVGKFDDDDEEPLEL